MTETTGRGKQFLKSVGIYAVGNIGSKLITFLMIPLYTFFVETSEFGYYDLCLTAVMLLTSFASLQLRDGAFRFLIDSKTDEGKTEVVSATMRLLSRSLLVFMLLSAIVSFVYPIRCLWLSFGLLVSMALIEVFGQMARGVGETKTFVVSNIISAFSIGALSVVFVVWCGWGITGIFLANIFARLIAVVYIEVRVGLLRKYFKPTLKSVMLTKKILRYVLPLLPTIMCWWLTTSSDRFFIQHYFSLSDNGIYAVAARFGAIMQIVGAIIFQAWQEMALRQYNSPDRDKFFSEMVNLFIMFMSIAALCFAFGLKIVYPFIVSPEYVAGIVYVFPIIASSVLYALSNILEVGYQCSFETGRALLGVGVSAAVNILLNFVLIQTIGIYGVVVTSVVTYAVLLGFRIHDSRRYFKINISKMSILTVAIGAVGVFPFYFTDSVLVDVVMIMIGLAAMTLVAPRVLRSLRQSKRGS
jgi:O-antigen/teichoic acid export membrane protein